MKIQGIYVAAATPFDHTGAIYKAKVQHNFEKWSRTSVAGFIVGGLAGEGPLLDSEDKAELFRLAGTSIPQDRLFIADVSAEGVHEAAKLARMAAAAGAKAVVSRPPHEYKNMMYGPESQMLFFRALSDGSPVPVLMHNAPLITGIDLLAETVAKLSEHPNIAGIVEAGLQVVRIAQIRERVRKEFAVLAGTETQVYDALKAGANGAAPAFASAVPYAAIAIWEAFRTREEAAAQDWQDRISRPSILVTDLYGAPGLKYAMDLNGYYGGPPRMPFVGLDARQKAEIEEAFRALRGC
jgi:4-hydroxy-2-oxoglutarate aldolase